MKNNKKKIVKSLAITNAVLIPLPIGILTFRDDNDKLPDKNKLVNINSNNTKSHLNKTHLNNRDINKINVNDIFKNCAPPIMDVSFPNREDLIRNIIQYNPNLSNLFWNELEVSYNGDATAHVSATQNSEHYMGNCDLCLSTKIIATPSNATLTNPGDTVVISAVLSGLWKNAYSWHYNIDDKIRPYLNIVENYNSETITFTLKTPLDGTPYNFDISLTILAIINSNSLNVKITGDSAIQYFTYDGATITGLTDEGKRQTNLVVPNTIYGTKIVAIADKAFIDNAIIKSIKLGSNMLIVGQRAFQNCNNLTNIICNNGNTKFDKYSLDIGSLSRLNIDIDTKDINSTFGINLSNQREGQCTNYKFPDEYTYQTTEQWGKTSGEVTMWNFKYSFTTFSLDTNAFTWGTYHNFYNITINGNQNSNVDNLWLFYGNAQSTFNYLFTEVLFHCTETNAPGNDYWSAEYNDYGYRLCDVFTHLSKQSVKYSTSKYNSHSEWNDIVHENSYRSPKVLFTCYKQVSRSILGYKAWSTGDFDDSLNWKPNFRDDEQSLENYEWIMGHWDKFQW